MCLLETACSSYTTIRRFSLVFHVFNGLGLLFEGYFNVQGLTLSVRIDLKIFNLAYP